MNDNHFLSNFGPPPQPKLIKIDPPKHTVPDVTLLFDSNDSYLWKVGANSKNEVGLPKNKVASPIINLDARAKIENVPVIESLSGQFEFPSQKKFPEPFCENFKIQNSSPNQTNKIIYDPEVYRSPVLSQENGTSNFRSDKTKICKGQTTDMLFEKSGSKITNPTVKPYTELKFNDINQDILKSGMTNLASQMKYHCYNQNHCFEANDSSKIKGNLHDNSAQANKKQCDVFCERNNRVSPIHQNRNFLLKDKAAADNIPKHKIDKHVLKILEEQKLQISQLQDVVEKVLNQQKNDADSNLKNSEKQCFCNLAQSPNIETESRKIAIVQTSFIKNSTRTIATNTDLTMKDISLLLDNKIQFQPKQNCTRRNNSLKIIHKNGVMESLIRDPIESDNNNENFDTVHKSKEISLKEASESIPSNGINPNEQEEYCEFEIEANEHPFFGESARNVNQKYSEREDSSELLQKDEINNLTCYNNIQINIQQKFLQRTEPAEEPKEENWNRVNSDLSVQKVEQQLQNFGISFLDPVTLRNKGDDRHGPELTAPFSFYPNYQLEAAYDKAGFPSRNQEGPMQNWRNVQMMLNKKCINRNGEENSVLTSSTIQFFNKHGLKK